MLNFGQSKFTLDRNATIEAYRQTPQDGPDKCLCSGCRNFRLAQKRVFPEAFLALLDDLGIDSTKPVEVYEFGRIAPGSHAYGGWYNFVGVLEEGADAPPVKFGDCISAYLRVPSGPRLPALDGFQIVQLEFEAENVPWILNEPESP